jgi:hypothetical protein
MLTKQEIPMRVNVDVYTKDIDAALAAFKIALSEGATNINLSSNEDYETKIFEHLNLVFEADHLSDAISNLDKGPFSKEYDNL